MADEKFSLDDLINEYDGKSSGAGQSGITLDLDEILHSIVTEERRYNTMQLELQKQKELAEAMSAPEPSPAAKAVIEEKPEMSPEMEKRRMELIQREIISGDYEHKYLGEDFRDVIEEEKRLKAEKLASFMAQRGDTAPLPRQPQSEAPPVINEAPPEPKDKKLTAAEERKRRKEEKLSRKKRKSREELEEDEFQRKYEELTRKGLGIKSRSERSAQTEAAFDAAMSEIDRSASASPGRTFSDKMEDEEYSQSYHPPRRSRAPSVVSDATGLFSFTQNDEKLDREIRSADDPLDEITGDSVQKFINEYEKGKSKPLPKSPEKPSGITSAFDKLMKPDTADDSSTRVINTEIMDGMKRAKQERLSKTGNIPPIERKSITDIDLNLDDKIIPDTVPIPNEEELAELEMLRELKESRTRKINDFVFSGDEEDSDLSQEEPEEERIIEDFEHMDDAMSIARDISQLKGTMTVRLLVLIACFAASLYITLSNELRTPVIEILNMRTTPINYLLACTVIGICAAISSHTVITGGFAKLFTMKADCDSLSALTMTSTILLSLTSMIVTSTGNLVREAVVHEYIPLGIAVMIFNTIGKLLILDRTQRNFKYISGDNEHYAIFMVGTQEQAEVFTKGTISDFPLLTAMRKTEMISDFMKTSYSTDSSDRFCRIFTPIIAAAGLLIGLIAAATGRADYGTNSVFVGLSAFVGTLCMCSCYSIMLAVSLPMHQASRRFSEMQGAMIGFDSIDEFSDTNSVVVDTAHLFPKGSVTLSALKIFSDTRIDEAIIEAASLATQSGSIMKNMFYDIIAGKTEMLNPVESYIYEDSMGLCGWINNKRVLLGNRKLMSNHSIEGMPSEAKEKEYTDNGRRIPVYLSISGELSAMFIIDIAPTPEVAQSLRAMQKHGIKVILRSVDSAITPERMADMFDIYPDTVKILPFSAHSEYDRLTSYVPKQTATLACSGKFAAFASLILGTRKIKGTISTGIALQAISILVGILLAAMFVVLRSFTELSVATILIYNLVFTLLYLIVNLFRRV